MTGLEHACHKVYLIKYHMIFVVKYRKDMLVSEDYINHMKSILTEIQKRYFLRVARQKSARESARTTLLEGQKPHMSLLRFCITQKG